MQKETGIQHVSPIVKFIGLLLTSIFQLDGNQDGHISWLEIINKLQLLGIELYGTVQGISWAKIQSELSDADAGEIQQLIADFSEAHDLRDEELEAIIENWLHWLGEGGILLERTLAYRRAV